MNKNLKGSAFLLSAALVWGMAFVAQKSVAGNIGMFTFVCLRSFVTCIVLAPVCVLRARNAPAGMQIRRHLLPGLIMGAITFAAILLQQWGLEYTSASKSGFVTALYIVIVPVLGLFFGRKPKLNLWLGVIAALLGAALLSLDFSEGFSVGRGEALTLGCALTFSTHIIYVDSHTKGMNSALLCALQFAVCCVLGFVFMLVFETPTFIQVKDNLFGILYVGGISGAVGYTFQIVGQKYAEPSLASLLMCMESVFAAIGGWLIGGEVLSFAEYIGCAAMLIGCILAQLPVRRSENIL